MYSMKGIYILVIFSYMNQIYGDSSEEYPWENHMSASTNDLRRLFEEELELISKLEEWKWKVNTGIILSTKDVKNDLELLEKSLPEMNLNEYINENATEYVYHPINAFHLMKRTTVLWPEILENTLSPSLDDHTEEIVTKFPLLEDFHRGTCIGLINIELYYSQSGTTFLSLAKGQIHDINSGEIYQAKHTLSSDDCVLISRAAEKIWRLDKYVEWLEGAIEVAEKIEGNKPMIVRKLKRLLNNAITKHDDALLKYGINSIQKAGDVPDVQPASPLFTAMRPFNEELEEVPSYLKAKKKYKKELNLVKPMVDLRPLDHKDVRYMDKSFARMRTAMLPYSKKLCNGDTSMRSPEADKNLKCLFLHYNNHYLRLGPFKYEPVSENPHVGMYREFYTNKEIQVLVDDSKEKLHSTIYYRDGEPQYYTSQRSSKRRHIYDEDFDVALTSSKRISLATRWVVHQSYLSSEQYHLINYGVGGQIEVHVDYWGQGNNFDPHPGGDRTVTLLGYCSDDLIGGYTIFPGLGLRIKPQKGDALFWLTIKNDREYDSRMFHMGCPVLYGSKWVFTKWLYSDDQMWSHPCQHDAQAGENFPIFSNQQRFPNRWTMEIDE